MGGLALDVAEEEGVDGAGARGEDDTGVVGHRAAADAPRRGPDERVELAEDEPVTGVQDRHRHRVCGRDPVDRGRAVGGLAHRRRQHLPHGPARDRAGQPVDVVGVEVGEDDGVEGVDPEPVEAAVDDPRVGTGVDEDGPARPAAQDDGVALADVADDDPPAGRRPRDDPGGDEQRHDDRGPGVGADGVGPGRGDHGPAGEQDPDEEHGEEDRAGRAVGPGHRPAGYPRAQPGDLGDARRGHDPGPRHQLGAACPPEGGQGRRDPGDGRRCDERRREQVGEDPDDADRPLEQHDDRGRHRLGSDGNREGGAERRQPRRQAGPDGVTPRPGEQQQPERGERRQHEPVGAGQPGVDDEDHEHRAREHRQARGAP